MEQFIDDGAGNFPNDYRLFVFDGTVEMIQGDTGRFSNHSRSRLYTPTWEKLPVWYDCKDISGEVPRPRHLQQIIAAAEALGRGLDFVRADFYDIPDRVY